MRKIKICIHMSLDGVVAPGGPGDETPWASGGWQTPYRTPEGASAFAEAQGERIDLLLGRRTHDILAAFWPTAKGGPFADKLNAATKYVATHRPESLGAWGPSEALGEDIVAGIRRVKATDGPDLVVLGSTTLNRVLFEHGLVDEVVVCVYPMLFGRGKRLFEESLDPRELALVSSKTTPTGVVLNVYRYLGAARRDS